MEPLVVAGIFLLIGSIISAVGGVAAAWTGHILETRNERSNRFFDEKARAFRQLMASAHEHWWRIREQDGSIHWELSADRASWISLGTAPNPFQPDE